MPDTIVRLRAFETEDIRALHSWLSDRESLEMVGRVPYSYEETEAHVAKKRKNGDLVLGVENADRQLVGWIFLSDIEHEHGRAKIGILIAPSFRGMGYGKQAMEQMIDIGFKQLRLEKIYLTTRGINQRAIALYTKLGFVREGLLRRHGYSGGVRYDTLIMGVLADEWTAAQK